MPRAVQNSRARETRDVTPDPTGPARGSPELDKSDPVKAASTSKALQGGMSVQYARFPFKVWSSTTWNETDEDDTVIALEDKANDAYALS